MRGALAWVTVLMVALSVPNLSIASAQTAADEEARTHFESGRLHFDRGEYEQALVAFQAAHARSSRTGLLYNIYLSLERLARYGEAADRLEQFLEQDTERSEQHATLRERVTNLRARAAATGSGSGMSGLGLAGIGVAGLGAASLVAFAVTGGLALGEDAEVAATCGRDGTRTCAEEDVAGLRTLMITADVLLAAGVVLAAAGATLLAIDLVGGSGERSVAVAPMLSPEVAGILVGGVL